MSTPPAQLNLSRAAEPEPRRRPSLNLSRSLEPPRPSSPARAPRGNPYSADDYLLDGDWSPERGESVKAWFKQTYSRDLPHRFGQTATHDRMGLDHSSNMDVQVNPQSDEGRSLAAYLRESRIPFLAYNTAKPGAATGPHFHVGRPSRGFGADPTFDLSRAAEPLNLSRAFEPDDDEVVSVNARRVVEPSAPSRYLQSPTVPPGPSTMQGRQARDTRQAFESAPSGREVLAVRLPDGVRDWTELSSNQVAQAGVRQWAQGRGIPADFVEDFLSREGASHHIYDLETGKPLTTGEAMGREDIYDADARTFRLSAELPILKRLADEYDQSLGIVDRTVKHLYEAGEYSPGEHALGVLGSMPEAVSVSTAPIARPLEALDAQFFSRLNRESAGAKLAALANPLDPQALADAYQTLKGERPESSENPVSGAVESGVSRIHPTAGKVAGVVADVVLSPSNVVAGLGAAKYARRAGQAAEGAELLRLIGPGESSGLMGSLRRAGRAAADVVQLPKAKAGFDLSAPLRQGLPQVAAHPSYLKQAYAEQVKAFASEDAFNSFVQSIRARPDYEQMRKAGLYLSSPGGLSEEAFASGLVKKIPGPKASDRAYSAALDSIRVQAWDNYRRTILRSPAVEHVTDDTWKAVADLVSISTGRGRFPILDRSEFGRRVVDALNVPFFSPRNTAAKFNVLSPVRIVRNAVSPATRPVAWLQARDAFRGLSVMGTTLGLLQVAGPRVGVEANVNPFSDNFGKVRVGKMVMDLSGGEGWTVRYLAQMAKAFSDIEAGREPRRTPGQLTARYLRSQLQPAAAVGVDYATGETFDRQPFTYSRAAADLAVPFVVQDLYKGWVAAGGTGAEEVAGNVFYGLRHGQTAANFRDFQTGFKYTPAALLSVLGIPVNFYDKPEDYEAAQERAKVRVGGTAGREFDRLGIVLEDLPEGERITVPDSFKYEGLTGDAVGFGGQHPGQTPEDLQRYRDDLRRAIERNVAAEMAKPAYRSLNREAQRSYVLGIVAATHEAAQSTFLLGARGREVKATEGLLEYQKRLEGRAPQPVGLLMRHEQRPAPLRLERALERPTLNLSRALEP